MINNTENTDPVIFYTSGFELDKTYFYHDGPILFTAVHEPSGKLFLFSAASEDDEAFYFIYTEISESEIASIENGNIDLRDAFLKAESGIAYLSAYEEEDISKIEVIKSPEISNDLLANHGALLTSLIGKK